MKNNELKKIMNDNRNDIAKASRLLVGIVLGAVIIIGVVFYGIAPKAKKSDKSNKDPVPASGINDIDADTTQNDDSSEWVDEREIPIGHLYRVSEDTAVTDKGGSYLGEAGEGELFSSYDVLDISQFGTGKQIEVDFLSKRGYISADDLEEVGAANVLPTAGNSIGNDEYGGSFENRYRFAVEIVKAIKKECGDDFPVSLRYSVVSKTKGMRSGALPGEEFTEVGRDMEESEKAAKYLQDAGYDMLNCDNGTYDAWYWCHPPVYMPENCNLEDVEHIKKFVDIPVVCAGRLDPRVAAESIAEGKLDGAGFARPFLADQEWVTKLMHGKEEEIRPCILCHNGCFNMCHYKGVPNDQELSDSLHLARCAVNAETMQWSKHYIKKTSSPKTVHIIGGGIGGMEAARVLKLRGHNPVIHEKGDVLGGTFIPASAESYKGKLRDLLEWYRLQMKELGIEIKFGDEIKDVSQFGGAPVIVATGSTPRLLRRVPGYEKMIEACEYLNGEKEVGETVAVIGGGLTGSEIAYELALQGHKPVIVEMKDDLVSQKGVCLANSSYLREWFALNKVPVYLETTLKEVRDGSIVCISKDDSNLEIKCDSVISCAGYIPAPLAQAAKNVYLVGDCLAIGNLRSVVWRAYEVAMKI